MSNKSGVSDQVIQLPEGGGALSGIGEKFSPDLFTGTGNFTVPIDVPAGRNGFQPELSLTYSTGNSNGPFGLGWALSVPGVSRKTSDGVPIYDDSADTFILSGAEDLVPVKEEPEDADSYTRYRPRTEGLFARIRHHTDATRDFWSVWSKDGLVSTYGTDPDSLPADEQPSYTLQTDSATIATPENRRKIYAWHLTRTEDPFGNRIVYEYDHDAGTDANGHRRWDQTYLRTIRYVDFEDGDDTTRYLVSVEFEYEDRPDPFSGYRSGFEIRTRKRCARILVRTHAGEDGEYIEDGRPIRSYDLVYLDDREGRRDELPLNGMSVLSRVVVTGHDGTDTEQLPPLEFGYTEFNPEGRDFFPIDGDLPMRSLASPEFELADLFGNGLPDIVEIDDTVRYWRNLGDGRFAEPKSMKRSPAGLRLADEGVQLIDANGDGRIDLLATINGLSGFFPLEFGGEWDRRSFQRYDVAPSFNLEDPEVQLVDLDGDGVTDAVRSGSSLECFFNDPEEGWNAAKRVTHPRVNFSDPRVKWADLSGDGLQDIVLVYDGNIEYWPSFGRGKWGDRLSMRNSPRFPYGYDPRRVLLGDVDGDGLSDLVYVDNERVLLWINQSGNRWSDRIEIDGTPPVTDMDAVRLVDVLGSGIPGVLFSADARGARNHVFFLDFTAGVKPYLLSEMDNHMGATTRIEYVPSTEFYLEDEKRSETRWETPLPFPVQCVSRVEAIDEISLGKQTTVYRYRHGYWDGAEREFRGFGLVEQFDTETFDEYNESGLHGEAEFVAVGTDDREQFSEPTLTKTWFHQGPIGPEFGEWKGADYSHQYWAGDDSMLDAFASLQSMLAGLEHRRERRDALRTLRGHVLRTELYALDGSEREDRPYTVTEQVHSVHPELTWTPTDEDKVAVFFPYTVATRTTQWERGEDPMTQFSFTGLRNSEGELMFDNYGQPSVELSVAVPRLPDSPANPGPVPSRLEYLSTCSVTDYARRDDDTYIVDRVARTTTYETSRPVNPANFNPDEDVVDIVRNVEAAIVETSAPGDSETVLRRELAVDPDSVVGQTLNFYDGDEFTGKPLHELGDYGALVRTEQLVLTDEILDEVHEDTDDIDLTAISPYLTGDAGTAWSDYPQDFRDEYPRAFFDELPVTNRDDVTRPGLRMTPLGYGAPDATLVPDVTDEYRQGYFIATERRRYDFQDSGTPDRGLVRVQRDPLDNDTTIGYDPFWFLPIEVQDSVDLKTHADYDYRVFQPQSVTDPNENRTVVTYTPLGLPEAIATMGAETEEVGDTIEEPGTRFEYDFLAFKRSSPDDRQPIYVHTIKRERHRWDLVRTERERIGRDLTDAEIRALFADELENHPERFIQTREYSDGFGRLLQTRTQAEDVAFGDERFGNLNLLVDQAMLVRRDESDVPGTLDNLRGRRVAVREGTINEEFARTKLPDSIIETVSRFSRAVELVNDPGSNVFAAVLDELVARRFENNTQGQIAFSTGPGVVEGRKRGADKSIRVVVSGWQTYDNKGRVVEKYEPFFASGWDYLSREEAEADTPDLFGQKATMYYDPRGQVVRTVNPDGSEQRVIYGYVSPEGLDSPDEHEPTPWVAYTYDPNDNAGRTHRGAGERGPRSVYTAKTSSYKHHWNTPASATVDALGRTVESVERIRREGDLLTDIDEYRTRSTYDIQGNLLTVTDTLGRSAFAHTYDLANNPLRIESLDAGVRVIVLDAVGNEVERRDSKGALVLQAYDELNRPIRVWARDNDDVDQIVTLRERLVYGDSDSEEGGFRNAAGEFDQRGMDLNVLGALYRHHDEAGRLRFERYDFKGNLLEKERQVITDAVIPDQLPIDWAPGGTSIRDHEAALLDEAVYQTSSEFDALNRVTKLTYPEDVGQENSDPTPDVPPERKELHLRYNRAGALKGVELVSPGSAEVAGTYVERIGYNANGQRTFVAYGNDVMTRYAYDPETFRLVGLRSERFTKDGTQTFTLTGKPLQDFVYEYDLVGNITIIHDRTSNSGVVNGFREHGRGRDGLDRKFTYDPLYRLILATGRECEDLAIERPWTNYKPCGFYPYEGPTQVTRENAPENTVPYTETYEYDAAGNMLSMKHNSGDPWTRHFGVGGFTPGRWGSEWAKHVDYDDQGWPDGPSNRLTNAGGQPTVGENHTYDANGNLRSERGGRRNGRLGWDHGDRLRVYQNLYEDPNIDVYYLYDSGGQRVKKVKLTRNDAGAVTNREIRVYVDGISEHYYSTPTGSPDLETENNTLHVMDDQNRISTVRVGDPFDPQPERITPVVQYHLGDHLGSSSLVIDSDTDWFNYEEYAPYGESTFGGFSRKRYRFSGKEWDEESGLYYHGARYYAPWIGRWISCDPLGVNSGCNLYQYTHNNPIVFIDPTGTQDIKVDGGEEESEPDATQARRGSSSDVEGELGDETNVPAFVLWEPIDPADLEDKPTLEEFLEVNNATEQNRAELTRIWRELHPRGVRLLTEGTFGTGFDHAFLIVTTDNEEVIVELWGPQGGAETGMPRVDPFWQSSIDARYWVEEHPLNITRPQDPEQDARFEERILEFAQFFQEQDPSGRYHHLPEYSWLGPNSNGYIRALVELAGGRVDLVGLGNKDISPYESELEIRFGPLENAQERATRERIESGDLPTMGLNRAQRERAIGR